MIGQTISHYKILEKLGQGGMGIVYKALDTTLDRPVALKFLPHHLTGNEAEQARFLQEARAASALNHPNVCGIHAVGEHEGQQFIDMEFVDGVTLRKRLASGGLPVETAIPYAIQIGEALEDAHAKGIVHRDVKCENIMINAKNMIKVMDFGLAKLKGSLKLTKTSSTVGTLAYMAPEQIQGAEVDGRSDIFSFGVVLFEMLTGHTPFRGEHEAAMMYSIINEEPEPLTKYVPGASSELLHILGRALEKNPEERYQSVHDMVIDLRRLKKESTRVSRAISVQPAPAQGEQRGFASHDTPAPPVRTPSRKGLWIAVAAVFFAVAGGAYFFLLRNTQPGAGASSGATLNPNMTLRVLQIPLSQVSYPGLSADGNWVSFPGGDREGKWDIYYMHISSSEPKRITNDSMRYNQQVADISPDGSQVGFTHSNGGLYIASSLGGASRRVVDTVGNVRWRPDAQRLGYELVKQTPTPHYELWTVAPDGSDRRLEFRDTLGTSGRYSFAWSPDGRSVAWIRAYPGRYEEVFTRELATGKELQLTFDKKHVDDVCWLRNGMILFSSNKSGNTNLWAVPALGGAAQQVTKGSGPDMGITASADAKKVLYLQQQPVGYVWIASTEHPNAQQVTFDDRDIRNVSLSPDRKRIAMVMGDPDPLKNSVQIYLLDRDGSNRRIVTSDESQKFGISWSPDGKRIAYNTQVFNQPAESTKVLVMDPDQPGSARVLAKGFNVAWISNSTVGIVRMNSSHIDSVSFEHPVPQMIYEDSTYAFPVASGKLLGFYDARAATEGQWVIPSDYQRNPSHSAPKRIAKNGDIVHSFGGLDFFLYETKQHEWWKYYYLSEKREQVSVSFPGLQGDSQPTVSDDGKEVVYISRKLAGKLVLIENLFP